MSILETQALSIGYRDSQRTEPLAISKDLNLGLNASELVCLVGPNGAGKSTLIRTLTGLQKPLAGEVRLKGKPIAVYKPRELAQLVGVVMTSPVLVGAMRVEQLVGLGRYPHTGWFDRQDAKDEAIIREALGTVGAAPLAGRYVNQLSDGERQRIMIARALAQEPELLILDEPTAFLDLPGRVTVMQLLRDLAHGHGKAVLSSTHDLDLALRVADRIWLMDQAGNVVDGSPEDLAMEGQFGRIFDKPGIAFDRMTGQFRMEQAPGRQVVLEAHGIARVWTEKALERAGYLVLSHADEQTPVVEVRENGSARTWALRFGGKQSEHSSIYSLLISLNS